MNKNNYKVLSFFLIYLFIFLNVFSLSGCGQKGDLYLSDKDNKAKNTELNRDSKMLKLTEKNII